MKPSFALILSHDGIRLLLRASNGWRCVGEVAPDDPNLAEQLKYLRQTATDLSGGNFSTKLILPNSQILYTKIDALGASDERRTQQIIKGLVGLTPYELDDLFFDWCDAGGGFAHVAIVARETLEEAENFALEHRMNPVSFAATPEDDSFANEIYFGPTRFSETLLAQGESVEPDIGIIAEIAQSESPDTPVVENAELLLTDAIQPGGDLAQVDEDGDQQVDAADNEVAETEISDDADLTFSTRRQSGSNGAHEEPLRLKWVAPRIAITTPDDTPDKGSATLSGVSRGSDVPPVAVTAPVLDAGKIPSAYKAGSDDLAAPKKAPTIPLAPTDTDDGQQPSAHPPGIRREQEARALTIFGARNKRSDEGKPHRLGLPVTVGLAAALAAMAFISGIFLDTPITSGRFWRGDNSDPQALTAQAVVASSGFNDATLIQTNDAPAANIEVAIEVASLTAPDIQTDTLISLTPEEVAESDHTTPLTLSQATGIYAASGIWQRAPHPPADLSTDRIDNVYVASIDKVVISNDAVALPSYKVIFPDTAIAQVLPPPPIGTVFDLDERGLVRATAKGALTPDGIRVFAGKPATVPSLRPGTTSVSSPATTLPADLAALAANRPVLRPTNLIEQNEKERLGGRSLAEIAKVRPNLRPASAQDLGQATTSPVATVVLTQSKVPVSRPGNFQSAVQKALAEATAKPDVVVTSAATVTGSAPSIPTKASVATEATSKNAINLSAINLIGVYGSSSERRALVRLKSGRYVKVQVGDRLDGGRVGAIGANELLYTKGNRNLKLKLPTG